MNTMLMLRRSLPWLAVSVLGFLLVGREGLWRWRERDSIRLDVLLQAVAEARTDEAERTAVVELDKWCCSKEISTGLQAFDAKTREPVAREEWERPAGGLVFKLRFDFDWDFKDERTAYVYARSPANILLLLRDVVVR
jgi:hypothetical protein